MLHSLLATIFQERVVSYVRRQEDVDRLLKEQVPCQHLVILRNDLVVELLQLLDHLKSIFVRHLEVKDQGVRWSYRK